MGHLCHVRDGGGSDDDGDDGEESLLKKYEVNPVGGVRVVRNNLLSPSRTSNVPTCTIMENAHCCTKWIVQKSIDSAEIHSLH